MSEEGADKNRTRADHDGAGALLSRQSPPGVGCSALHPCSGSPCVQQRWPPCGWARYRVGAVSYTHLRAHETGAYL
eukprot:4640889-Pyramimonas_sp.AAC.1